MEANCIAEVDTCNQCPFVQTGEELSSFRIIVPAPRFNCKNGGSIIQDTQNGIGISWKGKLHLVKPESLDTLKDIKI